MKFYNISEVAIAIGFIRPHNLKDLLVFVGILHDVLSSHVVELLVRLFQITPGHIGFLRESKTLRIRITDPK